jgi:hypothetical protein
LIFGKSKYAIKEEHMSTTVLPQQESNVWWVFLLQGIAGILLGLMLIAAPGATLVTLVLFLGFYWIVSGVLSLVQVFVGLFIHDIPDPDEIVVRISQAGHAHVPKTHCPLSEALRMCA